MNLRLVSLAGLVALTSAFAVAGCNDDDGGSEPTGGTGGASAGKGGGGGKAGAANNAGRAGGGSPGTAGDGAAGEAEAGAPAGGAPAGGASGASGSAGKGGTSAGAGGTSGSGGKSGSGGTGGATAGAGGSGGKAGSGGAGGASAGAGGASAGAGGASAGAGGASAGAGGASAGAGGSGGAAPSATGCTKLTAPFTTASTASTTIQSGYNLNFGTGVTANLTTATISTVTYVGTVGSATNLQYYVTGTIGALSCTAYGSYISVAGFTAGFATATLNVSSLLGNATAVPPVAAAVAYCSDGSQAAFDGLAITGIGINIINGTGTPATTAVWLDSLAITGAAPAIVAYPFTTSPTPFVKAGYPTITGATAEWFATCP